MEGCWCGMDGQDVCWKMLWGFLGEKSPKCPRDPEKGMLVQSPSASVCFSLAAGSGHRQTHPGALSLQRHPGA